LIATNTIAPLQILLAFYAFAMAPNVLLRLSPGPTIHTGERKMAALRNEELFEIEGGGFWEGLAAAAYALVTALVLL